MCTKVYFTYEMFFLTLVCLSKYLFCIVKLTNSKAFFSDSHTIMNSEVRLCQCIPLTTELSQSYPRFSYFPFYLCACKITLTQRSFLAKKLFGFSCGNFINVISINIFCCFSCYIYLFTFMQKKILKRRKLQIQLNQFYNFQFIQGIVYFVC